MHLTLFAFRTESNSLLLSFFGLPIGFSETRFLMSSSFSTILSNPSSFEINTVVLATTNSSFFMDAGSARLSGVFDK